MVLGLWALVVVIIASQGWSRLAHRLRFDGEIPSGAARYGMQSMAIGGTWFAPRYRGCVNGWLDATGLYLRPGLIFRIAHPLLRIPWDQIDSIRLEGFGPFQRLRFRLAHDLPDLTIHGALGRAAADEWSVRTGRALTE
ncbi:MAG: hypothetical protein H7X93_07225 [Sphingomonadaceae bacterium]|nr:hypothetical protein [Sphingomonadaceae bacterium]